MTKTLVERITHVLPETIHTDQKGCIKGRFIGENIRLTEGIVQEKDDDSVVLLLDQEKAFDRVDWSWMFDVMRKFNFGERFITWIETMYKFSKSAIMTNDHMSQYVPISRGIRQGDAMSELLFIIQSEPLAETIRSRYKGCYHRWREGSQNKSICWRRQYFSITPQIHNTMPEYY